MTGSIRKQTWDSELEDAIRAKWNHGDTFTLSDAYAFEPHFRDIYPANSFVPDKLRQCLQHLRDKGVVEFVDDAGTYRRI